MGVRGVVREEEKEGYSGKEGYAHIWVATILLTRVESRVWKFVVGAELAVQSQHRRWDDGTRHSQLQPALSSAGTDKWVLNWRLNKASVGRCSLVVLETTVLVSRPLETKILRSFSWSWSRSDCFRDRSTTSNVCAGKIIIFL